jgi:hypothetical protein
MGAPSRPCAPLTQAQVNLIQAWIDSGALNN